MSTINDVKASGEKLIDLQRYVSFLKLDCSNSKALDLLDNLADEFEKRLQVIERATELLQAIGEQICDDHGVEWGTTSTERIDRGADLSEAAEAKFQEYINFIAQHY